jgi:phage terminase large subunit-like protein
MAVLIYERAIHVHTSRHSQYCEKGCDLEDGDLQSYWPEHWPVEKLARKWRAVTSGPFGAGYQNDPNALSGNALERDWVHFYDQEMLDAHRRLLGVPRGSLHAGADPTRGGSGRDPDFFACIHAERLENRAYFLDFFNRRLRIDEQAQFLEDWITVRGGIQTGVIEDTSEKGYVWNDLQQVNKDPVTGRAQGTRFNWVVEKAQGRNAVGAKELRYLAMAPRFKNAQIMIPGIRDGLEWRVDPRWDIFMQEWCAFPSGHDDLLDAAFWTSFACFGKEAPASAILSEKSASDRLREKVKGRVCDREAHVRFGQPLDLCGRCMAEFEASQSLAAGREQLGSQQAGQPSARGLEVHRYDRPSVGMGLRGR